MPAVVTAPAGAEQSSGEQASMSDRASEAANQGKQAVSDVTSTAADKARQVTEETARQARDLLGEARGHLEQQAGEQHRNLVSGLRSLSDELGSMRADQPGLASELVSQAHERVNGAADWFERRQPGDLVGEIRDFARRRPGTFLLGAALAGIAVGRLTRGAVAAHSDDSDSASAHQVSDATTATPTAPSAGFGEPTDGLYGVGATPTTSYNASTEPAPEFGTPQQSAPGYGAPTYPATGGGYGGPQ
jgi:hypothetical protein